MSDWGSSIVLLWLISVSHQVSLGTQSIGHILSLAVIRVCVDVARQTKLYFIVLALQKHALHQSCNSEYYDNNSIFHIFVASCPLFVLIVRQCRASYCKYTKGKLYRPIKRIVQVKHNSVLILRIKPNV